jgi:hypothetical protein
MKMAFHRVFSEQSLPSRYEYRFLNNHDLGRPGHGLGRELRIGELGVLSGKIRFNYPTGSGTCFSDEDRDFELYDLSERLAKGRPANRGHAV